MPIKTQNSLPFSFDNKGHRARLRKRFLYDFGESMEEYELLELLLMQSIKRRDVKPLAKAILREFGSLPEVINADITHLTDHAGVGEQTALMLKLVMAIMRRAAREQTMDRHVIASNEGIREYCRIHFAHIPTEEFHLVLLDKQNHVTKHVCLGKGSISDVMVYPRDVVKLVLDNYAAAVLLIHNHPGGGTKPSLNDVKTTNRLRDALKVVDVRVFDHMIVARGGQIVSFKEMGMF